MNVSGQSVGAAARFFKVAPGSLLVVHDDVDLGPGRLQICVGGGLAGHNGLRSIASTLGTQDFLRLRIGASAGAVAATGAARWRTTSSRSFSPRSTSMPSWRVRRTPSRRSHGKARARPAALQLIQGRHRRATDRPLP